MSRRKAGVSVQAKETEPRDGSAGERLTEAAKRYIEEHSAEKFSLPLLSGALYVNGSYLLRTFRAHTGRTLLWYHNHVRCERAKALLDHSRLSVSGVGAEVGFVSPAHFSHIFRKMTGMSPTEYRFRAGQQEEV